MASLPHPSQLLLSQHLFPSLAESIGPCCVGQCPTVELSDNFTCQVSPSTHGASAYSVLPPGQQHQPVLLCKASPDSTLGRTGWRS